MKTESLYVAKSLGDESNSSQESNDSSSENHVQQAVEKIQGLVSEAANDSSHADKKETVNNSLAQKETKSENQLESKKRLWFGYEGKAGTSDRYKWKEEIAHGGLGKVSLAHDQNLFRDVAIKELLPGVENSGGMAERFLDEAIITSHLEHPSIVPIYELGKKEDGCPYYTMKLLTGEPLKTVIQDLHKIPWKDSGHAIKRIQLLQIFVSICRAMAFAHERGVIHRDLKPNNIVVGEFGEAVIVDWGLAKFFDKDQKTLCLNSDSSHGKVSRNHPKTKGTKSSHTQTGQILGTPAYLSPEQAKGAARLDARSDIYALGAILYEILVGEPAFPGTDTQTIIDNVRQGNFAAPKTIKRKTSSVLDAICLKAMSRKASDRYISANELADEIERFLADEPVLAYREKWIQKVGAMGAKAQDAGSYSRCLVSSNLCRSWNCNYRDQFISKRRSQGKRNRHRTKEKSRVGDKTGRTFFRTSNQTIKIRPQGNRHMVDRFEC